MVVLRPIQLQTNAQFLTLCIWTLLLFADLVNAQDNNGSTTRYYIIIIPGGAFFGFLFRMCCSCGKSKETETIPASPTDHISTQSTTTEPIRPTSLSQIRLTSDTPLRPTTMLPVHPSMAGRIESKTRAPIISTESAAQTNVSAETFMSQRMRDRQNRSQEVYSIPIELDESTTQWTMTTYPSTHLEGESTHSITHINHLYDHESDRIANSVGVQATEYSTSNILGTNRKEEHPPSYYSLFRSKK